MSRHDDDILDGRGAATDPVNEILDAARAPGTSTETSGVDAAVQAFRTVDRSGPPTREAPAGEPRRRKARVLGRLAAASVATKIALVAGATIAAAAGGIAVTTVVNHHHRNPAPPVPSSVPSTGAPTPSAPSSAGPSGPSSPSAPGSASSAPSSAGPSSSAQSSAPTTTSSRSSTRPSSSAPTTSSTSRLRSSSSGVLSRGSD